MLERNRLYYMNLNGTVYQCKIASLKVKLNELEFVDGSADISTAFGSCCIELPNKYIDIGLYGENIIDFALYDSSDDAVLNDISNASFWYDASNNAFGAKKHEDLLINKGRIFWADEKNCFFW